MVVGDVEIRFFLRRKGEIQYANGTKEDKKGTYSCTRRLFLKEIISTHVLLEQSCGCFTL